MHGWIWRDWQEGEKDQLLQHLLALGAEKVRVPLTWYLAEESQGQYDFGYWIDMTDEYRAVGIDPMYFVLAAPDWAAAPGTTGDIRPPQDPADYASFMGAAAETFAGQGVAWQIWNEANNTAYWGGLQSTAQDYMDLLEPAYAAIKAADPEATVVCGPILLQFFLGADTSYLEEALALGMLDSCDAVSVHAYPFPEGKGTNDAIDELMAEVEELVRAHGDHEIWLTEAAVPSGDTSGAMAAIETIVGQEMVIDEQAQADYAEHLWRRSEDFRVFWFQLYDIYYDCGVLTWELEPKQAYERLLELAE